MKVLLTCPRAPVTIEWIRIFKRADMEVILVDSLNYPIARYFKNIKYVKVPSAKLEYEAYKKEMIKLMKTVDWVVPNCEDIFYISKIREEIHLNIFFFMPERVLLLNLHHKFDVAAYLNKYVKFPKTTLIYDKKEIELRGETILKPVFSRFGQSVIREVCMESISELECSVSYPWVQQQKIIGKAICNYALILKGRVLAHVVYRPKYLLNESASTYFERYSDKRVDQFIETFAKDTDYTGQVAFDFIDDGKDIYVLECNPRATSGLHLLSEGLDVREHKLVYDGKKTNTYYRIGTTLYTLFGLKSLLNGEFKTLYKDHKKAKNVLRGIPFYAQFLSLSEMLILAIKHKKPLTQASTFDIEFDG